MRTNKEIVNILNERRQELGLSISELARQVDMAKSAVSRYFNFSREFPLNRVNDFSKVLKLEPEYVLGFNEQYNDITTIYNKLEPKRQKKVYNFAEAQLHAQNNKVVNLFDHKETVEVTAKVSAGTGITWLGDSTYDKEVTSKPKHYDEAFEINGDSMIPLFKDGEIIFVEHTQVIENGQIAVVQIDEETFIKKVYIEEDKMRLVSLNKDYEDIIAGDDCDIRIVGKVIM
ncbi:helix-turn-helix domain-containing protein [Vagococcus lutrae]|uniref:helix-turn-helix domain-containing protein n=1 Tax=Vagococcus lutrae TaxID=81947 RepID=UPI00288FB880|nr:XRE family transcriptional regulator [Vagococcus lutrae]MDT2808342.1 XRE family transcriptional regulator [Vagococcus lutrae]